MIQSKTQNNTLAKRKGIWYCVLTDRLSVGETSVNNV